MSLKDDVKLDINKLDEAAIQQPSLYEEWSTLWADAVYERDKLKEKLAVAKAEADESIRSNPSKYGWSKTDKAPTEAWILTQIMLDKEVNDLTQEIIKAQHEVNLYSSAKETCDHRLKALSILTELYKGNYFSAVSRNDSGRLEKVYEKTREGHEEASKSSMRRLKKKGD